MALKQRFLKDEIWVTKEGKEIPVGALKINHMRNILRMIIRQHILDGEEDLVFYYPEDGDSNEYRSFQ